MKLIDKNKIVAELERRVEAIRKAFNEPGILSGVDRTYANAQSDAFKSLLTFLDTIEVENMDFGSENENNNHRIAIGTKIRSKVNPSIILSIISDDCHEDEFECSNGSVLSLKQIEKYYDILL